MKLPKIKIYIASPYTLGDVNENVNLQIDAWHILRDAGYYPIAPLLSHFIHLRKNRSYEDWMDWDFANLEMCDAVIRIRPIYNGEERLSSGADREEVHAKSIGIPVYTFWSLNELEEWINKIDPTKIIIDKNILKEK
jgi:hypothetical protein